MRRLYDLIFGCHHGSLTWPRKRGRGAYRVCLDCGAEFDYTGALAQSRDNAGRVRRLKGVK
jgi:hypothetical protein